MVTSQRRQEAAAPRPHYRIGKDPDSAMGQDSRSGPADLPGVRGGDRAGAGRSSAPALDKHEIEASSWLLEARKEVWDFYQGH